MSTTNYVRDRRQVLGLSQAALASRLQTLGLDVTQQWLSALEQGRIRPTWDMLPPMAAALEVTPNEMVGWNEFVKSIKR